jgi:hypothetical protein
MRKQVIIDEIRRVAAANGGAAPGRARFASEAGIKESDWSGKYWARWSDALQEAGLASNKLQKSYDEDFLLERYISLIRELNRFPTAPEIRLQRRSDPGFPSHNTFARFGPKHQLAAKILRYCHSHPGYDDVARLCASIMDSTGNSEPNESGKTSDGEIGFVYLMKSGRYYKIGHSNSVGRREYELAIQLPDKLTTTHQIRTDDPAGIEAYWHRRFNAKRKNGEWFELTPADVRAFKRRKFM